MSRIGKKTIKIPDGVEVKVDGQTVKVKGPKGELERTLPGILDIKVESGFEGVSSGFEKVLEFSGVGFKAQVKGDSIELSLGYSNPVIIQAPAGVNYQVEKNVIKVFGIDKEKVGQVAALIRDARPPEPYKGTGIKYKDEIIIRKAGKKAVATAG